MGEKDGKEIGEVETRIPTLFVEGDGIADTFYKAFQAVHNKGISRRTQYDRKENGFFIDPPGRDARVFISVTDLFAEPSLPMISYVNVGKYIAEFLGAKDHLIVPREELLRLIHAGKEDFEATQWPYSYHQRLTTYPLAEGKTLNQLEKVVEKLAGDLITRRAIAITGVPEIDLFMKSDAPCLRELQFRGLEDAQGRIVLNTFARWRSRDLYKAWCDNLVGLRNLIRSRVALPLQEKTGKEVVIGPYSEENGSLHIYGQDYSTKGADTFLRNNPNLFAYLKRTDAMQEPLRDNLIAELRELRDEPTWGFPPESIKLIDSLTEAFESGKFKP